ncbi:Stf0 sulfotransferase [Alteromonas pelagimontana]|uniref:Stf0 sulfotransferase n=1 Tax=Alteromonas pelagimontana TaxID=1858656 RepID=A0A6M4MBK5_9ALTE|nr:Stf0 family sulfotransferase [Alteromonas pelagimontana]QJR80188.1 Stf0 sulfotransferase [Alteromonas pelagimontana]
MELYEDQFADKYDYPHQTATSKILVIASTVRSGSHMLGHVLRETGAFGFPLEYVNAKNLEKWKKKFGVNDVASVLQELKARRTSTNGVFGIKIHYSHVQAAFGGFEKLKQLLPQAYFVLLSRDDVVAQAISLAIARQTGSWIAGQGDSDKTPEYRFEEIDNGLRRVIFENASWRYTFAATGSRYMELNFKDVKADPASAVLRIADFMDLQIDPQSVPMAPVTKKQSKAINQQWSERFHKEFNGNDELMRYNGESVIHRLARRFS